MMASIFDFGKKFSLTERTGNVVYDTVAAYCDYLKLDIVSYQAVLDVYGEDFRCADIARLSHITSRKIKLSGKWERARTYPFIAFNGEDMHPVLCIPERFQTLKAYDISDNRIFRLNRSNKADFAEDGIVFTCPLPRKAIGISDVFEYGLRYISASDIFYMCSMALLSTLVGLLLPVLNEQLFDKLIPMGSYESILQIGVVILACSLGNAFFLLVKNLSAFRSVSLSRYAILDATFERLYHLPQTFIERFGNVDLVSRTMELAQAISTLSTSAMTAVVGMILALFYLIRMFIKSSKLAWASIIMIAITVTGVIFIAFRRKKYIRTVEQEKCEARNTLYDFLSGIMKVRLSAMEDRSLYSYQVHNTKAVEGSLRDGKLQAVSGMFTALISGLYTIVLYYIVVKKNLDLSFGKFTGFTSAFGLFTSAVMQLVGVIITIPQIQPAFERVKPIFEQPCEEDDIGTTVRFKGEIEADNISFSYAEDEKNVIDEISFKIKPGEYIGIVGPSGCGKSTLLKMLMGFEKPTTGKLYFDEKDMDLIDKPGLRRQMGVVLQDGKLISGTIYENVALAAPEITQQKARELLDEAGMKDDLDRMPMGILTVVSEFGGTISGGQQQRIMIARALANDPCILLFDEATSALDNKAQAILCDTLAKRNITRIVIAHRLITVKNCDRIFVMDKGRIIEEGTYDELAKSGGLFARMVKEQQLTEVE